MNIPHAILRDLAPLPLLHHPADIHAGDAVAFGGLDAKRLAIKIEVKAPRRAVASADIIKGQLLQQIAMRFRLITVTEPVLARHIHLQDG